MNASYIEEDALALPLKERAKLVERLLESLDDLPETEPEERKAGPGQALPP